ncbi:MAG: CoA-transferase [Syntrophaceae bacterium]|nr:CoA-transferase [Syntrophaceae bacterium]
MQGQEDKVITLEEAVCRYVCDGCSIALGAIVSREPMAVASEIVRQKKKDLTFVNDSSVDPAELLIAAGCIRRVEDAYIWMGGVGPAHNYRRAVQEGIPHYLEIEEYSNYGISLRFMAGAMGVPFLPTKSMLGSDMVAHNPRIKVISDPYGGEPVALVPASRPDVAFIHAQRADAEGNAQIWGMVGNDDNIARAAKAVVITCEEIVPTSEIRKIPNMTAIPSYCVSAVVKVPFCCHPLSVSGYYWLDQPFRRSFSNASKTREGVMAWIDEWVYDLKNHEEYMNKVGVDRLSKLRQMELDNYHIPTIETTG